MLRIRKRVNEVIVVATMKDIAELAGVSVATVSYCINGTKPVKQATRDRIMRAIDELNYVPNDSARTLRGESTREFGVVFPDIEDLSRSELLKGIIYAAEEADYSLQIAFSYNSPKLERKIIDRYISKRVSGLILMTCQPDNVSYFRNSIVINNIPVVFLDRAPDRIDANFLAFDNYQACLYLTKQLLSHGYRRMALMSGHSKLFSEMECIRGFTDAVEEIGLSMKDHQILETELSKEAAFRQTMFHLINEPPQAILASSEQLTLGILEAFHLAGIAVPEQTCVITLGTDCWNKNNYLPNVIHTSRPSYAMGVNSIQLLQKNLKAPQFFEKEFMLFHDNIVDQPVTLPNAPVVVPHKHPERTLRILSPHLPTTDALQSAAREFELQHQVRVQVDRVSYQELFDALNQCTDPGSAAYDLYYFDVSWLEYVARKDLFYDLTDFFQSHEDIRHSLIPKNLNNCKFQDRYCGFPIVGGSHILFYRRDLFDDLFIRRQFEAMYNAQLRIPKTWTEFNAVARFFTREYNPYSPTAYGTAVIGSIHEECSLEILVRLWSYNGDLFDRNGMPTFNTPQNLKGFRSLMESCRYAPQSTTDMTIEESFKQFGTGKIAMLLSFTEYATMISNQVEGDIISSIDCAMLPGKTPANVGWNLGVSKHSEQKELCMELMKWLCQKQTSYYMTILNGQSVVADPHQNHELRKLFPWLALVSEGQSCAQDRKYPIVGKNRLITPAETENILYRLFHKAVRGELTISEVLEQGQAEFLRLVRS